MSLFRLSWLNNSIAQSWLHVKNCIIHILRRMLTQNTYFKQILALTKITKLHINATLMPPKIRHNGRKCLETIPVILKWHGKYTCKVSSPYDLFNFLPWLWCLKKYLNIYVECISPFGGIWYLHGNLIIDDDAIGGDRVIPLDKRKKVDCTLNYDAGKVPKLDLKVWIKSIEKIEISWISTLQTAFHTCCQKRIVLT